MSTNLSSLILLFGFIHTHTDTLTQKLTHYVFLRACTKKNEEKIDVHKNTKKFKVFLHLNPLAVYLEENFGIAFDYCHLL